MPTEAQLKTYAKLLVETGCAFKPGQEIYITGPVECADFVRLTAQCAWELGAADVIVSWDDAAINRLRYLNGAPELFDTVPEWEKVLKEGVANRGAAILRLGGGMFGMEGVDPARMVAQRKATRRECPAFSAEYGKGKSTKCGAAIATPAWAKKVFPDLPEAEAVDKLWEAILKVARADGPDPHQAWMDHAASFQRRTKLLTDMKFDAVRYTSPNGTDLTIGMVPGHHWHGGGMSTPDGVYFFPNMPTEETFTSPDRERVDGIVHSSLPLSAQGGLIRDFWIRFEHGLAVEWGAAEGLERLESILNTDENARRLGECALVPQSSPISQLGILFYSTLLDENAASHLALGQCYAFCLEGGSQMSREELLEHHMNVSATHCDFMIGTADMDVTGITQDGQEVPIFQKGEWAGQFA